MSSQYNQFGGLFSQPAFLHEETDREINGDISSSDEHSASFSSQKSIQYQTELNSFSTDPDLDNILSADFDKGELFMRTKISTELLTFSFLVCSIVQPIRNQGYFGEYEQSSFDHLTNGFGFSDQQKIQAQQPMRRPQENVFQARVPALPLQHFQAPQVPALQVKNSQQPLQSYATAKQGGNALLAQQQLQQRLALSAQKQAQFSPRTNSYHQQTGMPTITRPRMAANPTKNTIIYQVSFFSRTF